MSKSQWKIKGYKTWLISGQKKGQKHKENNIAFTGLIWGLHI